MLLEVKSAYATCLAIPHAMIACGGRGKHRLLMSSREDQQPSQAVLNKLMQGMENEALASIGEVAVATAPISRVIVRERPAQPPKRPSRYVGRVGEKRRTILIDPHNRESIQYVGLGGHRGPLLEGHKRRGHHRTYRSPRYKNMLGKTSWIKPTWIGPREWTSGPAVYTVQVGD